MTSENKGQPIPIPTSSTRSTTLSAPTQQRWWWFDRGQRTTEGMSSHSATSPTTEGSPITSSLSSSFTSPDVSSTSLSDTKAGASLPAPTSDWGYRWRRDSLKFDQDDVMISMRLPPM